MSLPNPLNWLRSKYPRVQAALQLVDDFCARAETNFPTSAGGIKRGREKLTWVREQLERIYNRTEGWGPAFAIIWPILSAAIERWVSRRNASR